MQIVEDSNLHIFEELTPEKRPQDHERDGTGLIFETLGHGGEYPDAMPQAVRLVDLKGRACVYGPRSEAWRVLGRNGKPLPPERRPQDEGMNGRDLAFTTLNHGGEYDDAMPQEIVLSDRKGRSCSYFPIRVNGRAVDSKGFTLVAKRHTASAE